MFIGDERQSFIVWMSSDFFFIFFYIKGTRGIHWQKLMRNRRFTVAECVEVIILVPVVQHVIQ